jgi:hypothetical protein
MGGSLVAFTLVRHTARMVALSQLIPPIPHCIPHYRQTLESAQPRPQGATVSESDASIHIRISFLTTVFRDNQVTQFLKQ